MWIVTLGVLLAAESGGGMSRIASDERILFFPTVARRSDDGRSWIVPIHGWLFEPEQDSLVRRLAIQQLRKALGLDDRSSGSIIFQQRAQWFLVDNERGKVVGIRVGEHEFSLPASAEDGHFLGTVRIPAASVARWASGGRLPLTAILSPGDRREFRGQAFLVGPRGLSVISDIDDTIKITEVTDNRKLIANTFLEPFRAVEGMAEVYRRWANAGALFHFVSASPWQLYEPLSTFASNAGFPDATYHLKRFRLKDSSALSLLSSPWETKRSVLESILADYPQRKFLLVGDSGEKDPELYGEAARRHADQVVGIFIRDVTDEVRGAPRYQKAFQGVESRKWQIFRDPATLRLPGEAGLPDPDAAKQ